MANSPPDLVLVVVVEVVKEVLCSCLKVLEGWWKALVDVSLHSNTKVSAKRHCLVNNRNLRWHLYGSSFLIVENILKFSC